MAEAYCERCHGLKGPSGSCVFCGAGEGPRCAWCNLPVGPRDVDEDGDPACPRGKGAKGGCGRKRRRRVPAAPGDGVGTNKPGGRP